MAMVEEDGLDVGFTTYDYGCNVCPNKGWDGDKPVRYAIVPRGNLMCCERCGGCYGSVPLGVGTSHAPSPLDPIPGYSVLLPADEAGVRGTFNDQGGKA